MQPEASRTRWWWGILFLFAVSVRLFRVNWDQTHFFHPDERAIGFAVDRLSFSPLQLNPHFFAYGSLPLYLIKVVTAIAGNFRQALRGYDSSIFVGREISAVLGALTALLLAMLGARLYGRRVGLLAGVLMAAAVLHVQNSHFATSDVPLTFLILLALFFLIRVAETGRLRHYLAAGIAAGLAIATKFSALPIFLAIGIAILYRWVVEGRRFRTVLNGGRAPPLRRRGICRRPAVRDPRLSRVPQRHPRAEPDGAPRGDLSVHEPVHRRSEISLRPRPDGPLGDGTAARPGGRGGDHPVLRGHNPEAPDRRGPPPRLGPAVLRDHRFLRREIPPIPPSDLPDADSLGRRRAGGLGRPEPDRETGGRRRPRGDPGVAGGLPADLHAAPHGRHGVGVVLSERPEGGEGRQPALG